MKIMRSEIDKLILEEYEDYEFLTEVNTPIREALSHECNVGYQSLILSLSHIEEILD